MTTTDAGLDLKESFAEAMAEEPLTEDSTSPVSEDAEVSDESQNEQPAVESEPEIGLFENLRDDIKEDEQPEEDSASYEINGKQVTVAELKNGYMRQEDYTQKTQELAQKVKDADAAITLYQSFQDNPGSTLKLLTQHIGQTSNLPNQWPQPTGQIGQNPSIEGFNPKPDGDMATVVTKAVSDALTNDPRLRALESDQALNQLNEIFGGLEGQYDLTLKTEDKQFILEEAQRLGTADIPFVFAGLMQKRQMFESERTNAIGAQTSHGRGSVEKEQEIEDVDTTDFRAIWKSLEKTEL